jgi:hypothetical protein
MKLHISHRLFFRAWTQAPSVTALRGRLRKRGFFATPGWAFRHAEWMRRQGVRLKSLPWPLRDIIVTRYIVAEAYQHRDGQDCSTPMELVPGQYLKVLDRDSRCFELEPDTWVELPAGSWTEA